MLLNNCTLACFISGHCEILRIVAKQVAKAERVSDLGSNTYSVFCITSKTCDGGIVSCFIVI